MNSLACNHNFAVAFHNRLIRVLWHTALTGLTLLSFSGTASALLPARCGKDDCSIAVTQIDTNSEQVDITRPVVTQGSFDYKSIIFTSGDQITIDAGGCVQTGGRGKTWKRYVNPSGPNSDRLYFGSMEIPGVLDKTPFS
jgi:hypothetical protein